MERVSVTRPGHFLPAPPHRQAPAGSILPESVFGEDDRIRLSETDAFPWRAIGQITVTGNGTTALGTGVMISPQHMLTAGHVVLDGIFGGDDRADSMTVDFGEGGSPGLDLSAEMLTFRTLPAWESSRATGSDLALVTLDRSIGAVTGSFDTFAIGLTDFFNGANVNIAGYPADIAAGQALTLANGPIELGTTERLYYNGTLDTAGGMSGAPIWQFFPSTGERKLIGIHTTGVVDPTAPGALNGGTRLTTERLALIDEWIGQDLTLNPPDDRPDLAVPGEAMVPFEGRLDSIEAVAGGAVAFTLNLGNLGTAASAGAEIDLHLSTNATITGFDPVIATVATAGLAPLETREIQIAGTLPDALPSGSFFIGWRIDPGDAVSELDEDNNTGVLPSSLDIIGQQLPNLVPVAPSLSSTDWVAGQSVTVSWALRNLGAVEAAANAGSALLASPDPQVTADDRVLLADPASPAIAPGGESAEGQPGSFTVPSDLAPGTWHIAVLADPDGAVPETEEADNLSAIQTVTVTAPDQPPAAAPDSATLAEGGSALIDVLANDTDPEGGGLTLVSVTAAAQGAVAIEGGAVRYTPLVGFSGADSFGYTVADPGGLEASATVAVTVTPTPPTLDGGANDETLTGGAGDETVTGGGGSDLIDGRGGSDSLVGGPGADRLFTGAGPNEAEGGDDDDWLFGGRDADRLSGGPGNDTIFAAGGADTLLGGAGADFLDGGAGADSLSGGSGADTLLAGAGADTLEGGDGADLLSGGDGIDLLSGGTGADALEGGAGGDIFRFVEGDGADRIADFAPGEDLVHLAGLAAGATPSIGVDGSGTALLSYGAAGDTILLDGLTPGDLAGESVFLLV